MLITTNILKKGGHKDIERRKFTRLDHTLDVSFKVISGKDDNVISSSVPAVTRNISIYGICLESTVVSVDELHISYHSSMLYKNILQLKIFISENQPITVIGEVSWYNKVDRKRGYVYEAGVRFTDINDDDLQKIKDLIK